ncbi:MAG: methionine biosynthesis protein MetW [Pseudomonadota bacterium]
MIVLAPRADHLAIAARVFECARVLDVGCGDGALLALLRDTRSVDARGLELSSKQVGQALSKGLSVIQGDAEADLELFPDDSFDVAILSRTIQNLRNPAGMLAELHRIAPETLVSFTNYGHWRRRLQLLVKGEMPGRTPWHRSDMLHPCTAADLIKLADEHGLGVVAAAHLTVDDVGRFRTGGFGTLNWRADEIILHLKRK